MQSRTRIRTARVLMITIILLAVGVWFLVVRSDPTPSNSGAQATSAVERLHSAQRGPAGPAQGLVYRRFSSAQTQSVSLPLAVDFDPAARVEHLRALAIAGDREAAYQLALLLISCESPWARQALDEQRAQIAADPDFVATLQAEVDAQQAKCSGVVSRPGEITRMLRMAALKGHAEAILMYVFHSPLGTDPARFDPWEAVRRAEELAEFRAEARALLQQLAHSGDVAALRTLADEYRSARGMFERNDVLAAVYLRLALSQGATDPADQALLDAAEARFTHDQRREAERRFEELFARCCG